MLAHLMQRAEIDPDQHRDDHHPDQGADRQIDAGDFDPAYRLEQIREELTQNDTDDDTQENPQREPAFEYAKRRRCLRCGSHA